METLDHIDITLLKLLQNNSRLTTKELSQEVGLSISPVYERVKRLENEGYIERYVALLNPSKLNLGLIAFVNVNLTQPSKEAVDEFTAAIGDRPEIVQCFNLTGRHDFIMQVFLSDMDHYRTFLLDVLGNIKSIARIETNFVLATVKQTSALPMTRLNGVD